VTIKLKLPEMEEAPVLDDPETKVVVW